MNDDSKALEAAAKAIWYEAFLLDADECKQAAQAAVRAYLAQREADGAVMVPVEATEGMLDAVALQFCQARDDTHMAICVQLTNEYRAMIAARPNPAST